MARDYEIASRSSWPGTRRQSAWDDSAPHRHMIRQMLEQVSRSLDAPSLMVWGAGRCVDLDLEWLLGRFEKIELVDIDGQSVRQALAERGVVESGQLTVVGDLDLSGVHRLLLEYSRAPEPVLWSRILSEAKDFALQLAPCDVVISTCMLSQLVNHVCDSTESNSDLKIELLPVIRARHLQLLVQHVRPGGSGVLVTDVTSSDALPELANPACDLPTLLSEKVHAGNHFHGLNPLAIQNDIARIPHFRQSLDRYEISAPWVWNATDRHYLCLAYRLVRN